MGKELDWINDLISEIPQPLLLLSAEGQWLGANSACLQMLQLSDVSIAADLGIAHPVIKLVINAIHETNLSNATNKDYQEFILRKIGDNWLVKFRLYHASFIDFSKLTELLEHWPEGIMISSIDTRKVLYINHLLSESMGYHPHEIIGHDLLHVHPSNSAESIIKSFTQVVRQNKTIARDIPMQRKDGSTYLATILNLPASWNGQAVMVGIFRV